MVKVPNPAPLRLLLLLALPAVPGCASDDGPTAPPPDAAAIIPIDFDRAWPHEDGRSFAYAYAVRTGVSPGPNLYPTAAEVPAVTLDLVASLLLTPPPFTSSQESTYGYTLTFEDSSTTGSGVRGQRLVPVVTGPTFTSSAHAAAGIAEAPLLLTGGVWRQEPGRIALYRDPSNSAAWIFLQGALADRTPWEARPLPQLAPAVVMRARAWQTVTADVAGFHFDDALDVHYLFDYGVVAVTDAGGAVLGYRRDFDYGRVVWGSDLGPLYVYQRTGLTAGEPPSMATQEATLLLEQAGIPALSPR